MNKLTRYLVLPLLLLSTPLFAAPQVLITTNYGDITIELAQEQAPKTVKNFLHYVESGSYNNSIFHRVIGEFMIQGGGFLEDGSKLPTDEPVANESRNGLSNLRGTIAMARTNAPHSATRQFFINQKNNPYLDGNATNWGYTVFGKVVNGMEVVDKIASVKTGQNAKLGMGDFPLTPVIMKSVTLLEKSQ